jgi:tetraacyldisaccharide-1-P 4'-kinase
MDLSGAAVPDLSGPAGLKPSATYEGLGPVVAVAAIANTERFFDDLRQIGVDVRSTMTFADHHPFSRNDVAAIAARARECACALVLTTEKDAMRLRKFRPLPIPIYMVPLTIAFDPPENFDGWIADHLAYARALRPSSGQALRPSSGQVLRHRSAQPGRHVA